MKMLILHLSDIHIRTANDVVLARSQHIVDAVKNLDPEVSAVVCVLSGDITHSGIDKEYLLALDFVHSLKTGLEQQFADATISFVAVPGNHDCDLSEATNARDVLLSAVRETPGRLSPLPVRSVERAAKDVLDLAA